MVVIVTFYLIQLIYMVVKKCLEKRNAVGPTNALGMGPITRHRNTGALLTSGSISGSSISLFNREELEQRGFNYF